VSRQLQSRGADQLIRVSMNKKSAMRHPLIMTTVALGSVCLPMLGGCAGTPVPKEEMAVAQAALQRADTSSTKENAAGPLQLAIGKMASARQAMVAKDFERAKQLAEEAQVDAQVAELHAQSAVSRKAAQESQEAARVLNDELSRKAAR
jgi:hypothetical protein